MRLFNVLALLLLCSASLALADDQSVPTYKTAPNWVTRHLDEGGSINDVTGLTRSPDWKKHATFVDLKADGDLPASYDWRNVVAGGLQPIKNQGSCGSCWAFSITAVVESLLKIQDSTSSPLLSEQELVDCSPYDCGGGDFDAFDYIRDKGLSTRADYPYTGQNGRCKTGSTVKQKVVSWAYVGSATTSPTIEQMKAAIMKYGPVSVDVSASGGFMGYSSGVYNGCNQGGINHMTDLVGWDDATSSWIMRNSWGSSWGENGYMRIKYTDSRGNKCNQIGETTAFAVLK